MMSCFKTQLPVIFSKNLSIPVIFLKNYPTSTNLPIFIILSVMGNFNLLMILYNINYF